MYANQLKKLIGFTFLVFFACQSKENDQLKTKLDSAYRELNVTKQALLNANEIKALLDSIDANRKVINPMLGKDTGLQRNVVRLTDINDYVKDINVKMDQMEKSIKYVNSMAASILKLQTDIEARTQKISKLEAEAYKINNTNRAIIVTVQRKDSTLAAFIETCHQDVATLQKVMEDIHLKNNITTANVYFKQAEVLASLANNIRPASKRKSVQQEALEMYRISLSLGKEEAQQKIAHLQTQL